MITETEYWLIVIALVATISSIGFGIWSNSSTKKSNELHEKQLTATIQPWISISDLDPSSVKLKDQIIKYYKFKELSKKQQEDLQPSEIGLRFYIENIGLLSVKANISTNMGTGELTKESVKDLEIVEKPTVLMPKQKISRLIPIPFKLFENRAKSPLFIYTRIRYEFKSHTGEIKEETVNRIWKLNEQGIFPIDYW